MLRVVLTQLGLFLLPFMLYGLWLMVRRRAVRSSMNVRVLFISAMAGAILSLGFLILFGEGQSAPPGWKYVPPHMEGETYVPGRFLPPDQAQ